MRLSNASLEHHATTSSVRQYGSQMEMVSLRHSLGGKWAGSPLIALLFFIPASVIVAIQERNAPLVAWWWFVAGEAIAQHLATTIVITGLVAIAHRRWSILPSALTIAIWAWGGAARGAVGGWFVGEFSGADPEYGFRIFYWVLVTLAWNTLVTYIVAQFDLQRSLLAELGLLRSERETEHSNALKSEADLKAELLTALHDAVAPVLVKIRNSVEAASVRNAKNFESIRDQIVDVSGQIDGVVNSASLGNSATVRPSFSITPLRAALQFDISRPVFASSFVMLGAATILIPEEFRDGGIVHAIIAAVALAAGSAMLSLLHVIARPAGRALPRVARLFRAAASLMTAAVYIVGNGYALTAGDTAWVIFIPICFYGASTALSSAVGLADSNLSLLTELNLVRAELDALRDTHRSLTDRVRSNLSAVLHGPILGRLSACVMALNFHANSEQKGDDDTAELVSRISAHLELVIEDVEILTAPRSN